MILIDNPEMDRFEIKQGDTITAFSYKWFSYKSYTDIIEIINTTGYVVKIFYSGDK